MNIPVGDVEICSEYLVCNCPTNYIKLALPIYISSSGVQIACMRCHASLEDCRPALPWRYRRRVCPTYRAMPRRNGAKSYESQSRQCRERTVGHGYAEE